jgi:hypothetical protein
MWPENSNMRIKGKMGRMLTKYGIGKMGWRHCQPMHVPMDIQ